MVWRGDRHGDAELDEQHVEQEHFVDPDGTEDDGERSVFASGWFRAALAATALALALVLALPYLLDWLEAPTAPPKEPIVARPAPRFSPVPASPPAVKAAPSRPVTNAVPKTQVPAPTLEKSVARATPVLPPREPRGLSPQAPRMATPAATPHEVAAAPKPPRGGGGGHWVQLGLFRDYRNAERFAESVRGQGFPVDVASITRTAPDGGTYHVVRAGAFSDEARAAAVRDDLRSRGYAGFLTEGAAK